VDIRPPSWKDSADVAATADIVFVQLPQRVFLDGTSAGLVGRVLDALNFIVGCAGSETRRIVVNLSYASDRGAHDGRSMFDIGVQELNDRFAASGEGRELELVVASGNAYAERQHATVPPSDARGSAEDAQAWVQIPPDNEMPAYLTIAADAAQRDLRIRITPPGNREAIEVAFDGMTTCWPSADDPRLVVVPPARRNGWVGLLSWSPTSALVPAGAPQGFSGAWRIELTPAAAMDTSRPADLWFATSRHPLGGTAGIQQPRFLDADGRYDPARWLRAAQTDEEAARIAGASSVIRRSASLSGLACAPRGGAVQVAGARESRQPVGEHKESPYSSVGPAPRNPEGRRRVDGIEVADVSRNLPGIIAAGTLSGQSVRVTGTSFAAPQRARRRANR
jgi:hypothetical protein